MCIQNQSYKHEAIRPARRINKAIIHFILVFRDNNIQRNTIWQTIKRYYKHKRKYNTSILQFLLDVIKQ